MLWYYVTDHQERLAIPEEQMAALAGSGILRPTTLLWHKGLPEWVSAGELKPELFLAPVHAPPAGLGQAGPVRDESGLVTEMARTMQHYTGWVQATGWMVGFLGVVSAAAATVAGYFAWKRPDRIVEWSRNWPEWLGPQAKQPWPATAALAVLGLILLFMGAQLIGAAVRTHRAAMLQSRDELRIALRSLGSFFRTAILTLLLLVLVLTGALLHHHRPWQKAAPPEPVVPSPAKERVTI